MKEIDLQNIVIRNITDFLTESELIEDSIFYDNPTDTIRPPSGLELWKFIIGTFKFNELTLHLFESLKSAVDDEVYVAALHLQQEILNNTFFSEEEILSIGRELITEFGISISRSEILEYLAGDVHKIGYLWQINGMSSIGEIIDELMRVKTNIYSFPASLIGEEGADLIMAGQGTPALMLVDKLILFFNIISKTN